MARKNLTNHVFDTLKAIEFDEERYERDKLNPDIKRLKTFWKTYYDKNDNFAEFLLVINILKLHKILNATDFHSGNIGKDKNGNYKAFDFDININRLKL